MRLKSYFATTVEAAMTLARQELGPEAMLMNSRKAAPENRHLGEYEVVFALFESGPAVPAPQMVGANTDRLAEEIADLKTRIDRMSASFARARFAGPVSRMTPEVTRVLCCLIEADVEDETAAEIALKAAQDAGGLREALSATIRFDDTLGRDGKGRRVVALVGPPGCGKTTALVKLATRYGIACRRPTQIISADGFRIGAADQLRAYAAILGTGFQSVETPHALAIALEEHRHKDLVLIDTPGLSDREMDECVGLAALLSTSSEVDVHLVVPASMRTADLRRTVQRFETYGPRKLLFTKVDETDSPGVLVNEAVRTRLPVSFLSTGQRVPEDLVPATPDALESLVRRVQAVDAAAGVGH